MKTRILKNSGIEWIGEIPKHWEISKINHLYSQRNQKVSDKDFKPLSVTKKGILPQLENAAKTNNGDSRKLVKIGDFVINSRSDRRGSCGISLFNGSVSLINIVLEPRQNMNSKYFDWLFHTENFADEFYKYGNGIVDDLWSTRWDNMKKILAPVPPIDEQERIAEFLDKKCEIIDKRLENLEQKIQSLKEYKKSLISECVTKGLKSRILEFRDSGIPWIGRIPKHWEVSKIKYVVSKKITDGTHQTPEYTDENDGSPFLSAKDVVSGYINWDNIKYITKTLHKQLQREVKPQKDDVLLAKNGTIGIAALVTDDKIFDIYVTLALIRPNKESVLPKFLLYMLNSQLCKTQFDLSLIGIGVQNLHLNLINNVLILVPPLDEQEKIAEFLDKKCASIDKLKENYQSQIHTLKEYKKSLIYECVTGKKEI